MTKIYINKTGSIEYCYKDIRQKCFDKNKTCISNQSQSSCNTEWWISAMPGPVFGNIAGTIGGWGIYGVGLKHLYTEIEAPDEYLCGYDRPCFDRTYCDTEVSDGVCVFPRIVQCKAKRCVGDYLGYNYDACFTINGKDREKRCCTAPADFKCKEGECDFVYSIVKKEYTVEYELVRSSYVCSEKVEYPKSFCCGSLPLYDDTCFKYQSSCTPEEKCSNPPGCKEDVPPKGYTLEETEFLHSDFWYGRAISWDYERDDCSCKCQLCISCGDYECKFAGYENYDWGIWGKDFQGIGTDCCGQLGNICPEKKGDGSSKPWYCNTGDDCEQVDDTDEDFDDSNYVSGPYTSYNSCIQACAKDNKCMAPDRDYTRGLCCDPKFKKQMDDIKKDACKTIGPSYKEKAEEILCSASGCSTGTTRKYNKEMCTIDNSQFCTASKVERIRTTNIYSYKPPIQNKQYNRICNSCDPDINAQCEKDPQSKCPTNTQAVVLKVQKTFHPEEVIDSTEAKLIVTFCEITTKECTSKT